MKVAEERPADSRPTRGKAVKRKVRIPRNAKIVRFFLHPAGKTLIVVFVCLVVTGMGVFIHFYNVYSKMIDERLRGGALQHHGAHFRGAGFGRGQRQDLAL